MWREINQSKIPPVKSWQMTNRRVSSIWRHSRQSMWIYIMIQIQSGVATLSIARSLAGGATTLKLVSLSFNNAWEVDHL